jgi:hypothetical protein
MRVAPQAGQRGVFVCRCSISKPQPDVLGPCGFCQCVSWNSGFPLGRAALFP